MTLPTFKQHVRHEVLYMCDRPEPMSRHAYTDVVANKDTAVYLQCEHVCKQYKHTTILPYNHTYNTQTHKNTQTHINTYINTHTHTLTHTLCAHRYMYCSGQPHTKCKSSWKHPPSSLGPFHLQGCRLLRSGSKR